MSRTVQTATSLRCALVLGQSGTLGTAVGKAFSEHGWRVLGTGHCHPPPLSDGIQVDLTQESDVERLGTWLKEKTQHLEAVIHCVGGTRDQLILKMTDAEWNECLDVNLNAAFRVSKLLLPWLTRQKDGHLIFISSWSGRVGRAGQANYAAAKAGLIALTQSLAREYASRGIRANCIVPGVFESPMTGSLSKEAMRRMLADSARPQLANVEEMARFILDLANMKGVSGQVFQLDGRIGAS